MSEHDSQVAVIQWCQLYEAQFPALAMIFAVPNAGKRSIGAARYYLMEGLKSGVPDLLLCWSIKPCHGLAIEMKDGDNKVTPNQKKWLHNFVSAGWKIAVCYSADEAVEVIGRYLNIPPENWLL
jgi:hypothetical protein